MDAQIHIGYKATASAGNLVTAGLHRFFLIRMTLQVAFALYPLCLAGLALVWMATATASTRARWLIHLAAAGCIAAFAFLAGPWAFTSYHLRYALLGLFAVAAIRSHQRISRRGAERLPLASALLLAFAALDAAIVVPQLFPHRSLELSFPLAGDNYYVLQGGDSVATNPFHALAGDSKAVDIVRLNAFGNRAKGIAPSALGDYEIYGEQVYSPCAGTILSARGDLPDNPPGQGNVEYPEGNHVVVGCAQAKVLLAHLKPGSVVVAAGQPVASGQAVGSVGNSGNTLEPHLHMAARTAGEAADLLFDGRRPAMNSVLSGAPRKASGDVTAGSPAPPARLIPFKTGKAPEERWGYRDGAGRVVIAPAFLYAGEFSEGLAPVWIDHSQDADNPQRVWIYIGTDGRPVGSRHYKAAGRFDGGRALVLLDGEFVFVDRRGEPTKRLGDVTEPRPVPAPAHESGTLRKFGEQLGTLTPEFELKADPSPGETSLTLYVRALKYGVTEIREVGWEGEGYILAIPSLGLPQGVALAKRILGRTSYVDIGKDEVFPGETTLQIEPEEFIRIRPAKYRAGGIEIEHTRWFG